jgi:pimeloyl-ACP methyl ester carboxylesterase
LIDIKLQARLISAVFSINKSPKKITLAGHSYGAPIALVLGALYPNKIEKVINLAGAVSPNHERIFWISYPADWLYFRWLVPKVWQVTNDEKLSHVAQLKSLLPLWKDYPVGVTIVHGQKDKLVPVENAYFLSKALPPERVKLIINPGWNHIFPFTKKSETLKLLLQEN